jgi:hypothetical protein
MSANPYRDPRAMRNAIADRLRPLARERGIQLSSLQRQFPLETTGRAATRVARDAPQLKERDLVNAVEIVGRVIDPVLSGIAQGLWNPRELRWHHPRS